jgi:catechol-2,3-dioxygenase
MNDPRPDIAIGHVRLQVGDVAKTTDFFVKLGSCLSQVANRERERYVPAWPCFLA